MDAFTAGILQRIRNAEDDLRRAMESGDEFLTEVEQAELDDLRQLAAEHGIELYAPESVSASQRAGGGAVGSRSPVAPRPAALVSPRLKDEVGPPPESSTGRDKPLELDPAERRRAATQLADACPPFDIDAGAAKLRRLAGDAGRVRLSADDRQATLTEREHELLRLLALGLSDDEIARRLHLARRSVVRMMAVIMERLGAANRFEAGVKAAHRGWV